jgi:hypothetical protein
MAYDVTDRYKRSVTASYQFAAHVEIIRSGVTVASGLRVVGGDVRADATADVLRTCTVEVVGLPGGLIPTSRQRTPLDIYGNELVVHAGITYPDGTSELVPQGVFTITDSDLVDTADGIAVSLSGEDRAGRLGDAKLLTPWSTAVGTDAVTAIRNLAEDRYPGLTVVDLLSAADTFPPHVLEEKADPWGDGIQAFAEAVGAEAYFDRDGRLVVRDVPDPSAQPVAWQFVEGPANPATKLERRYSRSAGGANAVVVTGENSSNSPVRAVAIDDDPESPTYYYGSYGQRPVWETSPLVTTTDQAQRAADARLRQLAGATEVITVSGVPNHAIDPGDIAHVTRLRSGFDDTVVVQAVSLPLSYAGEIQLNCRVLRTGGS